MNEQELLDTLPSYLKRLAELAMMHLEGDEGAEAMQILKGIAYDAQLHRNAEAIVKAPYSMETMTVTSPKLPPFSIW